MRVDGTRPLVAVRVHELDNSKGIRHKLVARLLVSQGSPLRKELREERKLTTGALIYTTPLFLSSDLCMNRMVPWIFVSANKGNS